MTLNELLKEYRECLFYDSNRYMRAKNGDNIELTNIGCDFARCEMFEQAIACWQLIEAEGHANAEVYINLGVSYYYGNGVPQNEVKAVSYYLQAALLGHPYGQYNYAVACEQGNGTEKNMEKAIYFYREAANQHVNEAIDALCRLGLYDEVHGLAFYSRDLESPGFTID